MLADFFHCTSAMASSYHQHIPRDIIELIIDEIASGRSNDSDEWAGCLRACSLVSPAFLRRSRIHLFSHIDFLVDQSYRQRARRLLKVLSQDANQYLVSAIHSFRIRISMPVKPVKTRFPGSTSLSHGLKLSRSILGHVSAHFRDALLELLCVFACSLTKSMVLETNNKWDFQPRAFGPLQWNSVMPLISTSSLRDLHLRNIGNLDSSFLLAASPHLKTLTLHSIQFADTSPALVEFKVNMEVLKVTLKGIERLELCDTSCSKFSQALRGHFVNAPPAFLPLTLFSSLLEYTFSCDYDVEEARSAWKIAEANSRSLRVLDIVDIGHSSPEMQDVFELSSIPHLQTLKFGVYRSYRDIFELQELLGALTHCLNFITPVDTTSIEISYRFALEDGPSKGKSWVTRTSEYTATWLALDRALMSSSNLPHLQRVALKVHLVPPNENIVIDYQRIQTDFDRWKSIKAHQMPALAQAPWTAFDMDYTIEHYTWGTEKSARVVA